MQFVFEMQELFAFALQHFVYRYARPSRYDIGNVGGIDLFFNHRAASLLVMKLLLQFFDLGLFLFNPSVAQFGHFTVIAFAFGFIGFELRMLDIDFVLLNFIDQSFFSLPFRLQRIFLFPQIFDLTGQHLFLYRILFTTDGFALNFELLGLTHNLIEFFGNRIDFHTQFGRRFVHQVDGLVGKETVGNIPMRQLHGGNNRLIHNPDLMMRFVFFFQSPKNRNRVGLAGFVHHHRLETPFQRLVFLEILLILIEGGRTDSPQFPARQGRLQNISRVHGPFALSGSDQRMDLVDKQDDLAFGLHHFVHDRLQALFELAFIFGSRDEGAHVERKYLFTLQVFRHVASDDTMRQSLGNGRFTRSRLADKNRIVLGAAAQYL